MITVTEIIHPLAITEPSSNIELDTLIGVCKVFENSKSSGELQEPGNYEEILTLQTLELHLKVLTVLGVLA